MRKSALRFKLEIEDTSFSLVTQEGKVEFIPIHAMQTNKEAELHPFFNTEMGEDDRVASFRKSLYLSQSSHCSLKKSGWDTESFRSFRKGSDVAAGNLALIYSVVRPTAWSLFRLFHPLPLSHCLTQLIHKIAYVPNKHDIHSHTQTHTHRWGC